MACLLQVRLDIVELLNFRCRLGHLLRAFPRHGVVVHPQKSDLLKQDVVLFREHVNAFLQSLVALAITTMSIPATLADQGEKVHAVTGLRKQLKVLAMLHLQVFSESVIFSNQFLFAIELFLEMEP